MLYNIYEIILKENCEEHVRFVSNNKKKKCLTKLKTNTSINISRRCYRCGLVKKNYT